MRVSVLQDNLAKAISIASRFTSAKAQLPVLGNILLKADKNKIIIGATNLESSISISVGAKVKKGGSTTVPSAIINNLVGNIKAEAIDLVLEKENLQITSSNFNSNLNCMNANDFPEIPNKISKASVQLSRELLVNMVGKTSFAASTDEVRPVLTGILFITKKGSISMVSTDGFRLSRITANVKEIKNDTQFILPRGALVELVKLAVNEKVVEMSFNKSENQAVFSVGNIIFSTRIIDGEFPDYEKIIPKSHKITINTDKEELSRAVKLASVFARDASNMLSMDVGKNTLEILAESSQSGKQKTSVDALVKSDINLSKGFKIAFNYRFLDEFLASIDGEEVRIELTDPNDPGVFTDPKDKNYLHLIMPVKLS